MLRCYLAAPLGEDTAPSTQSGTEEVSPGGSDPDAPLVLLPARRCCPIQPDQCTLRQGLPVTMRLPLAENQLRMTVSSNVSNQTLVSRQHGFLFVELARCKGAKVTICT